MASFGRRQHDAQSHDLLHDGSVRLDFMTDDVNEAKEVRIRTLASDCAAEIRNSNEFSAGCRSGGDSLVTSERLLSAPMSSRSVDNGSEAGVSGCSTEGAAVS